jgi:hypothetical protein
MVTFIGISNTPNTYSLATALPTEIVDTGLTYFTLTNNSSVNIYVSIQGTNFVGTGATWVLDDLGLGGAINLIGARSGISGGTYSVVIKKTAPYNNLIAVFPAYTIQKWGIRFLMPSEIGENELKQATITLVATQI